MEWHEIHSAIQEAEHTQRAADQNAGEMARMLVGRLRAVNSHNLYSNCQILRKLKKELKDFNSHTGEWK